MPELVLWSSSPPPAFFAGTAYYNLPPPPQYAPASCIPPQAAPGATWYVRAKKQETQQDGVGTYVQIGTEHPIDSTDGKLLEYPNVGDWVIMFNDPGTPYDVHYEDCITDPESIIPPDPNCVVSPFAQPGAVQIIVKYEIVCWLLTYENTRGKIKTLRGPDRYPSTIKLPKDAIPSTVVLFEDGVLIPPHRYKIVQ